MAGPERGSSVKCYVLLRTLYTEDDEESGTDDEGLRGDSCDPHEKPRKGAAAEPDQTSFGDGFTSSNDDSFGGEPHLQEDHRPVMAIAKVERVPTLLRMLALPQAQASPPMVPVTPITSK